jgi:signal transduction histidine kinase
MSKYRTSIITLCLLTILGSILINRFFNRELSKDVERESQRLESVVFRTYIREYQRISILIQSVQQIRSESEEGLKKSLELLLQGYGENGQIPHIIKSAAYSMNNQISIVIEESETGVSWQFLEVLPEYAQMDQSLKEDQVQIRSREEDKSSYLYYGLPDQPDQKNILLIFELNKDGIDQYYANPALKEALEQYTLEWVSLDNEEFRETIKSRKDGKYPFKPLQILTGWDHDEDMRLIIPLPDGLNSHRPFIPGEKPDSMPEAEEDDDGRLRGVRSFFPLDMDTAPFRYSGNVLMISSEGAPYYSNLEKRTALNWLMSQLILLGIGLVFLILIIQLRRTKEIRSREKEFVASMTHELRTPITVIQSAADNLSKGIVSEEKVVRYGQMMKDQTERLSNMIEEILLFSSLEGKSVTNSAPVEMDILILLEEMKGKFSAMADEKQINLHWDYDGLPSRLYGYPSEIKLILSNLISNALNHASGIKVSARHSIPGKLRLTVEDSGPGIAASEQKKIFDPFYRSLSSREQQTRGSGLGLFIARKKTGLINGDLKLESPYKKLNGEKSSGCRFTLEISSKVVSEEHEGEI